MKAVKGVVAEICVILSLFIITQLGCGGGGGGGNPAPENVRISGTVSDSSNDPVAGAVVSLVDEVIGRVVAETTTDANGKYVFEVVKGPYSIRVSRDGYELYDMVGHWLIEKDMSVGQIALTRAVPPPDNQPLDTGQAANQPPVMEAVAAQEIREGASVVLNIVASDPDGDSVAITAGNLPAGAAFDGNVFSWTAGLSDAGTYSIVFTARDGRGASTAQVVTVEVLDAPEGWDIGIAGERVSAKAADERGNIYLAYRGGSDGEVRIRKIDAQGIEVLDNVMVADSGDGVVRYCEFLGIAGDVLVSIVGSHSVAAGNKLEVYNMDSSGGNVRMNLIDRNLLLDNAVLDPVEPALYVIVRPSILNSLSPYMLKTDIQGNQLAPAQWAKGSRSQIFVSPTSPFVYLLGKNDVVTVERFRKDGFTKDTLYQEHDPSIGNSDLIGLMAGASVDGQDVFFFSVLRDYFTWIICDMEAAGRGEDCSWEAVPILRSVNGDGVWSPESPDQVVGTLKGDSYFYDGAIYLFKENSENVVLKYAVLGISPMDLSLEWEVSTNGTSTILGDKLIAVGSDGILRRFSVADGQLILP